MGETGRTELRDLAASLEGAGALLRRQQLGVPKFQRSYSWTTREVGDFWWDIQAAMTRGASNYFVGSIVLAGSRQARAQVIDGQQRIATVCLLIAVIAEEFEARDEANASATIRDRYLASTSLEDGHKELRFELGIYDRDEFSAYLLHGQAPSRSASLRDAVSGLRGFVSDYTAAGGPEWKARLLKLVEFIEHRLKIIVVEVATDADAFVVFETLNDRGLALSVADLIKNYLFSEARDQIEIAEGEWSSVLAELGAEAGADSAEMTNFIRQWWVSLHGTIRERDLYGSIRQKVQGEHGALASLAALHSASPIYAGLQDPDHRVWIGRPELRPSVAVLTELGVEQYRPLAIAALLRIDPREHARLLTSLVAWSVRGVAVGGLGGGSIERAYAESAMRVSSGEFRDYAEIADYMADFVPSDREFGAAVFLRPILRTSYLRYFLSTLDSPRGEHGDLPESHRLFGIIPRPLPWDTYLDGAWDQVGEIDELRIASRRLSNFVLVPPSVQVPAVNHWQARAAFANQVWRRGPLEVEGGSNFQRLLESRADYLAGKAVQAWPLGRREERV